MRELVFENSFVVPSNPEITRCPSQEGVNVPGPNVEGVSLTAIENDVKYKGRSVIAVLGPIACDQCAHRCTDAYVTIGSLHDMEKAELEGVEFGEPADIALLKGDGFEPAPPASQKLMEAHYRAHRGMFNDVDAMKNTGSLSIYETEVVIHDKTGRAVNRESLAPRGY